jgi:hypothetical protein
MIRKRNKFLGFHIFLVLAVALAAMPARSMAQNETPYDLINAINDLRASRGLAPYTIDPWIMEYAQEHAEHMPLSTRAHIFTRMANYRRHSA